MSRIQIIAEIGVNHNGDMALGRKLIDEAKRIGADAVKFQTFKAENLATPSTPKVDYQKSTTDVKESHFEMLKKLELTYEQQKQFHDYCLEVGIEFLSTPYDIEGIEFLSELGVKQFKVASADLIDIPLHESISSKKRHTLISVGMATYDEIDEAVAIYRNADCPFTLLHCVSNYPCDEKSLQLKVLKELQKRYQCPIGYSDHSVGPMAAFLSVGLGVHVIEKHFTLDKSFEGPDHKASSDPEELKELITLVRRAEKILGSGEKKCQAEEAGMANVSRKSVTCIKAIKKGDEFTLQNINTRRPARGLKPKYLKQLLGNFADKDYDVGYQFQKGDLNSFNV